MLCLHWTINCTLSPLPPEMLYIVNFFLLLSLFSSPLFLTFEKIIKKIKKKWTAEEKSPKMYSISGGTINCTHRLIGQWRQDNTNYIYRINICFVSMGQFIVPPEMLYIFVDFFLLPPLFFRFHYFYCSKKYEKKKNVAEEEKCPKIYSISGGTMNCPMETRAFIYTIYLICTFIRYI